ncbi:MAG TPA: ABC transporter permease [Candidatus Acidoferrales bacterium]|nr:ABC transporter permease [Candidatus Acidoferrales bacterium]
MNEVAQSPAIHWSETWHLAMEALRANRVRAALTMLGVVIGSACIVLVVTIGLTGRTFVRHQIEAVGSNLVFASLAQPAASQNVALSDEISESDMEAVRQAIPQVVHVAGTSDLPLTVLAGGKAVPVVMVGVTPEFEQIRNLVIPQGRYFDSDDFSSVSKVCVVSEHLADTVAPGQNIVGQELHVGELTFTVIGVFRERIDTFGQSEIRSDSLLVPFPLVRYYTGDSYLVTLYAQAGRAEYVPLVTNRVAQILKSRHRPEAEYNVENLSSILDTSRRISFALTIVLLLVALLALVISGIGIMNIMLVTVSERTREIGLRKAIGARPREILCQFLVEAILISGVGAVIGIGIAVAIPLSVDVLARFLPLPAGIQIPVSWLSVLAAFVVSCATGVLFGYLPARTAAQLQPVESLRFE